MVARLAWGHAETAEVHSIEELDRVLDSLTEKGRQEGPFTVELTVTEGTAIGAVLGRDDSHLEFYARNQGPLVVGCRGPWDDDELIVFTHRGDYSELPRRFFVPIDSAREALRHYFRTGARPENIAWGT